LGTFLEKKKEKKTSKKLSRKNVKKKKGILLEIIFRKIQLIVNTEK